MEELTCFRQHGDVDLNGLSGGYDARLFPEADSLLYLGGLLFGSIRYFAAPIHSLDAPKHAAVVAAVCDQIAVYDQIDVYDQIVAVYMDNMVAQMDKS